MKTYQFASVKNLRSLVIMISLSVSGMMISSCTKEDTIVPGDAALVAASDESANQRTSSTQTFSVELPLIYAETAGGFREAPQYNFAVYASGKVVYTGIRSVGTLGKKQFDISAATVNELAEFMVAVGFLTMEDKYPYICDGSQHTTMLQGDVSRKSMHKTVVDFSVAVPQELLLIRKTLEDKLGITTLIKRHTGQTQNFAQVSQ